MIKPSRPADAVPQHIHSASLMIVRSNLATAHRQDIDDALRNAGIYLIASELTMAIRHATVGIIRRPQ